VTQSWDSGETPSPGAWDQRAHAGLVLVLVGGIVVFFSTFISWSFDLAQGLSSGVPVIDAVYWTGLTAANLATVPAFERWLWIADAAVTCLCVAGAVWAALALATRRVPVGWPMLVAGFLALLVFVVETADWVSQDALVFGLLLSTLGAVVVIVGAVMLAVARAASRRAAAAGGETA
jgi:hypothetical protein